MNRFSLAIMFLFTMGCGPDLETLKQEACACKDIKCFENVAKKAGDLNKKFKDKELTEVEAKLLREFGVCMAQSMLGDMMGDADRKEEAAKATGIARQVAVNAKSAQDTVEQIAGDLAALDAKLAQAEHLVASATSDAERSGAQAQLTELTKQRSELQQRIAAAKAAAAKAARAKGLHLSKECLDNPLAKGCS